jgi:hypothetical protein
MEEDLRRFKQVVEAVEAPARSRKPAKRG